VAGLATAMAKPAAVPGLTRLSSAAKGPARGFAAEPVRQAHEDAGGEYPASRNAAATCRRKTGAGQIDV
jgi:hypothetical protein